VRAVGLDPVHDTRECFRAVLSAMSEPGTVEGVGATPADHAVLATLVDHEVSLATPDEQVASALDRQGRLTTADPEDADVVHAPEPTDGAVRAFQRGTLEEPSDGATVVYRVRSLSAGDGDESTSAKRPGTTLELDGPGVDGRRRLSIDGLPPEECRAIGDAQSTYPRGVDVVLASEVRVGALPRSVGLEVV
jgi:alpha-D-ribose 1-methylphosphonate 5-triphosphate synthase subunit PhnH